MSTISIQPGLVNKVRQIESMLSEVKKEMAAYQNTLEGEKDIANDRVTTCKTNEELNDFFESL